MTQGFSLKFHQLDYQTVNNKYFALCTIPLQAHSESNTFGFCEHPLSKKAAGYQTGQHMFGWKVFHPISLSFCSAAVCTKVSKGYPIITDLFRRQELYWNEWTYQGSVRLVYGLSYMKCKTMLDACMRIFSNSIFHSSLCTILRKLYFHSFTEDGHVSFVRLCNFCSPRN